MAATNVAEDTAVQKLITGAQLKAVHNTHSLKCRMSNAAFRTKVAERCLLARELNGYSQSDAARLFGYKNSTQLSQWEQAKRMPPIQRLLQASGIYRVSMDYLLGVSDEPDRDPMSAERLMLLSSVSNLLDSATRDIVDVVMAHARTGGPTIGAAHCFTAEGQKVVEAFKKFRAINADFDDLRGGNTLVVAIETFEKNGIGYARQQIERFERLKPDARGVLKRYSDTNRDLFEQHD